MAKRPIPDHIKVLKGTDQPSRMNPDQPQYTADEIQCPPHYDKKRRLVWMDIVPQLIIAGAAKNIDAYALEAMVDKWCEYQDAQSKLEELGKVIRSPNGYPQLSPYYSIAKSALSDWGKLMMEFGMTPASRTRVKIEKDKKNAKNGRFDGL